LKVERERPELSKKKRVKKGEENGWDRFGCERAPYETR
jgi:hypothetical protein